jgi:hypothetical protein
MDVQVERRLRRLGGMQSMMEVTRVEWRGMHMEYTTRRQFDGLSLKTTGWWFRGFVLKTRAEVPRKNGTARVGNTEVASRRSKSV